LRWGLHCANLSFTILLEVRIKFKLLGFVVFSIWVLVARPAATAQATNQLHFPLSGFSIAALEETPGGTQQQALMMFLPVAEGFAANVNVLIQSYEGTLEDYIAITREQLKKTDFKLLDKRVLGKTTAILEYTGEMQGRALHWYARAEKSGGRVYLATATATEEQWKEVASRLKSCVDSLNCDGGGAAKAPSPQR